MKEKFVVFFLLFIIFIPLVNADFNKKSSIDWLTKNTKWQQDQIQDVSLALLALLSNNINPTTQASILLQRQDSNHCYPKNNCNVKDTAFALLFLNKLGIEREINATLTWMGSTKTKANINGQWLIQVLTDKTGKCVLTHNNINFNFSIDDKGKIQPYDVNWLDIKNNLKISIEQPIERFSVECKSINDPNMVTSLLRQSGDEIYIVKQESGDRAEVELNSACYPLTKGGSCDVETSFLTSWVIYKTTGKIDTMPFLEDNAQTNIHYAILNELNKGNQKYVGLLTEGKNKEKYWDDVFTTSFVIDSLKSTGNSVLVSDSIEWLKLQQISTGENKGSFNNGNMKDTAAAIYLGLNDQSTFNPGSTDIPPEDAYTNQTQNNKTQSVVQCVTDYDCYPGICNQGTCKEVQQVTSSTTIQEPLLTTSTTIEGDTSGTEGDTSDTGNGSSILKIIIPLAIIIFAGIGIFLYKKFSKKPDINEDNFFLEQKRESETSREMPTEQRRSYRPSPKDEAIERELEKSLNDARDLFKKK
ncbi:hypothetical protein J4214_04080 [Candidatus Woesearchaeota archaeon]|nr:hypothetical protein [Candidatus Woesearchaeota archaeon]